MKNAKAIFALAAIGSLIGLTAFASQQRNQKNTVEISPDVAYCQQTGARDFAIVDAKYPREPLFKLHAGTFWDGTILEGRAEGEHGNSREMYHQLGTDSCVVREADNLSFAYKLKPAP